MIALTICSQNELKAGTSYESQIGGLISGIVRTLVTGEFAGRRPSQAEAKLLRPICGPDDFEELRAAANNSDAFDKVHQRCRLTEFKKDDTHIHINAYLPAGYCEVLKGAFDTALAERVFAVPKEAQGDLIIEYKGSRYSTGPAHRRESLRNAGANSVCNIDGSLRVSAPRKKTR